LQTKPFGFNINLTGAWQTQFDGKIERRLSALSGQYDDQSAFQALLDSGDPLIYEVYEIHRPHNSGELLSGVSVVHPGKVGQEYYMTKGHYHLVRETAEIYYCLRGQGYLLMENEDGEWCAEEFRPGRVVYVPPGWAHRSVNVSPSEDLITFFAYPGHAGHDYATIETCGFRKLIVEQDGRPAIVNNPRWTQTAAAVE
jgi:glucose-6-phosphate isomerase